MQQSLARFTVMELNHGEQEINEKKMGILFEWKIEKIFKTITICVVT